jgi:D-beta-D-heptose 7-phosphate kinase/D-beta-D-heptose 1-phosphate adenosyltransferase
MLIDKLNSLQLKNSKPNILVIGDLMLDHYIWGNSTRLSPEAPVPVVNIKEESTSLGGAANVVKNLAALGARVTVAGITGNDIMGEQLIKLLSNEDVDTNAIIKDCSRTTTVKTRVLVGHHQLVRLDREVTNTISETITNNLINKIACCIANIDLVVLSDYNKGLFTSDLTQSIINIAKLNDKKVVVDPKGLDYKKYKGAYLIKPNRKELAEAVKIERINSIDTLKEAASVIFEQTDVSHLVVTLSEQGLVILSGDTHVELPVKATEVFDVTGAGDTVLASIAYFLSVGLSLEESCELANHAAAIVIRHLGTAATTIEEIAGDIEQSGKQKINLGV